MNLFSVAGFLSYNAQESLGDVLVPEKMSINQDYEKQQKLVNLVTQQYHAYKRNITGNINFDAVEGSKQSCNCQVFNPGGVKYLTPDDNNHNFSDVSVGYSPLQVVYVFFDTATYDEIERDVKVNLELQL